MPSSAPAGRAVPDVAMDADPTTGMLIGETQTYPNGEQRYGEYRIGGTSLASPLFAGMTALTLQNAGGRLGFLNPLIYGQHKTGTVHRCLGQDVGKLDGRRATSASTTRTVNDPTDGLLYSVRTFGQDASLHRHVGLGRRHRYRFAERRLD